MRFTSLSNMSSLLLAFDQTSSSSGLPASPSPHSWCYETLTCGPSLLLLRAEMGLQGKLLTACLKSEADTPFAVIDKSQGVKAAMELKIRENLLAFQNTLALNDEKTLKRVVDKILSAKKIEIYGIFNSGIVATSFCYQLIQLGIPATFVSDTLMCAISASMLDKDSLVIAISASGRTKEILDAVKMARNNGVSVICLTANGNSPLTQLSDDSLLCASSGMTVSDRSEEIRLSQYLIVDTLCAYLRSITDQSGQTHYFKLREILNSHNVND